MNRIEFDKLSLPININELDCLIRYNEHGDGETLIKFNSQESVTDCSFLKRNYSLEDISENHLFESKRLKRSKLSCNDISSFKWLMLMDTVNVNLNG